MRTLVILLLFAATAFAQTPELASVRVYSFHDKDQWPDCNGSGWLITDTQIVTAYHVVHGCRSGNKQVQIRFPNGWRTWGVIEATDLRNDLALIWINSHMSVKPIPTGDVPDDGEATIHGYGYDYEYKPHKGKLDCRVRNTTLDDYKGNSPDAFLYNLYSKRSGGSADIDAEGNWQAIKVLSIPGDSGGPVTYDGKVIGSILSITSSYSIFCRIDTIKETFKDKLKWSR